MEALRARLLMPCRPLNKPYSHYESYPNIEHENLYKAASRRWIARYSKVYRALINALSSRPDLEVEREPLVGSIAYEAPVAPRAPRAPEAPRATRTPIALGLKADLSALIGTSRYYYDIQIVAINKPSSREEAYATLEEAAIAKIAKYRSLGPYFRPLIFSAGGLMAKETSKAYKELQSLLIPSEASWLDTNLGLIFAKTRALSAISIAKDTPRRGK